MMAKAEVTLAERARVAAWLLGMVEGEEVSQMEDIVRAAIIVLTGEA
jgi:hypothetical protein